MSANDTTDSNTNQNDTHQPDTETDLKQVLFNAIHHDSLIIPDQQDVEFKYPIEILNKNIIKVSQTSYDASGEVISFLVTIKSMNHKNTIPKASSEITYDVWVCMIENRPNRIMSQGRQRRIDSFEHSCQKTSSHIMISLLTVSKWIHLKSPHECYPTAIATINSDEFIVYGSANKESQRNLFHYNSKNNTINQLYLAENTEYCSNMYFDDTDETMYIVKENKSVSTCVSIPTNNNDQIFIGEHPYYFLIINNYCHAIASNNFEQPNMELKQYDALNQINKCHKTDAQMFGKIIYVSSKQCIILIGGFRTNLEKHSDEVWVYELTTQKWTQICNITLKRYGSEAVLTSNEKYVVLLGGTKYNKEKETYDDSNDIFVLDMGNDNHWKIKHCTIKCPIEGSCVGTRTGGIDSKHDVLVMGFVRECFKLQEFNSVQLPPQYIVGLIGEHYSTETIHWIKDDKHCAIGLQNVLTSLR